MVRVYLLWLIPETLFYFEFQTTIEEPWFELKSADWIPNKSSTFEFQNKNSKFEFQNKNSKFEFQNKNSKFEFYKYINF